MKFYDSFHGVGGFRYGLEQAGMECVGGCEIDKYACQAYGVINDEDCRPTDIRTVDPIRLPDFDVFVGGFPCQDLSVAGKRKGFDGERSVLFFEILRICEVKRPTYILLENVTGLFSHNNGETFRIVLQSLDELGYDAEWQVHNSAIYVPQNRERIFIIGHLRGRSSQPVFPFGAENKSDAKQFSQGEGISYCLDTGYSKGISENIMDKGRRTMILEPVTSKRIAGWIEREDKIFAYRSDAKRSTVQEHVYIKPEGITDALTVGHTPKTIDQQYRIRKLTPLECFRLQSFPDWWYYKLKEHGISDSQLYKMAGNAVSSIVAFEIAKRLLGDDYDRKNTFTWGTKRNGQEI